MRTNITFLFFALLALSVAACAERQTAQTEGGAVTDTAAAQTQMDTTSAQAAQQATVGLNQQEPYGPYLVDGAGMSLYMFKKDEKGSGESTCYDACAEAWPPLLTSGSSAANASAVDTSMLGTIKRRDGSQQVTYNGWPLYYFQKDQQSGDVQGQDVEGFGAEWYLVSAEGTEVHGEDE
jgi:predicted lipoprotein with Yx(FWY)xxD motif